MFSAITTPTSIGALITQGNFQEKLFLSVCSPGLSTVVVSSDIHFAAVLHKLISCGQLRGSLHGHGEKALYVPAIYTRRQNKWADSFLSSNGYLGV